MLFLFFIYLGIEIKKKVMGKYTQDEKFFVIENRVKDVDNLNRMKTPVKLFNEMLAHITIEQHYSALCLNVEAAMLLKVLYKLTDITCIVANEQIKAQLDNLKINTILVEESDDALEILNNLDMKFDIVIGNPPYQEGNGSAQSKTIWHKFVQSGLNLTQEGGYFSMIHPNGWRSLKRTFKDTNKELLKYHMKSLKLRNYSTGLELFGVNTTCDSYVIHKVTPPKEFYTEVEDVQGNHHRLLLSNIKLLPDVIRVEDSMLVDYSLEETVKVVYNTHYHTSKQFISDSSTDVNRFPIVYTLKQQGPRLKWSSRNDLGDFGIPKIVLGRGVGAPILDLEGNYTSCEFSYYIQDTPDNLRKIYDKLISVEVLELLQRLGSGKGHRYGIDAVRLLRRDMLIN